MQGDEQEDGWRYLPGLAVLAIVAIVLITCLGSLDSATEDPCEQGHVLRSAGLLDKAEAAYRRAEAKGEACIAPPATVKGVTPASPLQAIERDQRDVREAFTEARVRSGAAELLPALRAYVKGLEINPYEGERHELEKALLELVKDPAKDGAAAAARCNLGRELTQASLPASATKALAAGIAKAPADCQPVLTTLQGRVASADEHAAKAAALSDAGDRRREYVFALRGNAELSSTREALEGSFEDESTLDEFTSWLGGVFASLKDALSWIAPLAIGLLLIALGAWILLGYVGRRARGRAALAGMGGWWGFSVLRKAALPKLAVEDFEGKGEGVEGKDFSALLAPALPKRVGREPNFVVERYTKGSPSSNAAYEAATVISAVSATKALGSVAELLLKMFRRRTIAISGRLQPIGDRGAGLTVTISGAIDKSIELWDSNIDAHPGGKDGARWLRLVPAATAWCRWQLAPIYAKVDGDFNPEGWQSEALFQSGIAWERLEEWGRARDLYVSARESDSDLLTAEHNLAMLEVLHFQSYEAAQTRVARVQDKLNANPKLAAQWPTLEVASLYAEALAWTYPTIDKEDHGQTGDLEKGWRSACKMVEELAQKIADASLGAAEREVFERSEGASVVLLADCKARRFPEIARDAAARVGATDPIGRERLRQGVADLDPWDLIEGYVLAPKGPPKSGRRTDYNLACYFAMLAEYGGPEHGGSEEARGKCSRRALEFLDAALVGGAQAKLADADPELRTLKESKPEEFKKIIEANQAPKPAETAKPGGSGDSGQ